MAEHATSGTTIFQTVFRTSKNYKDYITIALQSPYFPYSNAKHETSNKLTKAIKRPALGFRNCANFRSKILITLNMQKAIR
ncbi:transposase [Streptococcus thoraltensis]|uniref:transposase n=1 Tax=Streptococcus thoraltensis TaxID=55085 RepID=UPI0024133DF1|nr:transposase [Streptococcus thoraltensis]